MSKFMLKNVRISFPALFQKAVFDGNAGKYEATFLIDKDAQSDLIEEINTRIDKFLEEKFGAGKVPKSIKRTVFKDGDHVEYQGYENHMAFKAGSANRRPTVIDRDKSPLIEEDGKPMAGDYVNAVVGLWYSDHPKGGKQVLGNLMGVQFYKEGERFGSGDVDVMSDFEELEDSDDF